MPCKIAVTYFSHFFFLFRYFLFFQYVYVVWMVFAHNFDPYVIRDDDDDEKKKKIEIFWYVGNNRRTAFLGTVWVTNASSIVIVANTFATSISVSAVFMARIANVVIDNRSISYANQCNCWTLVSIWFSGKWRRWVFDFLIFILILCFVFFPLFVLLNIC